MPIYVQKPIQGKIWEQLTYVLDESSDIFKLCETRKARELDDAYSKMCEQFKAILSEEQREIYEQLYEVAMDVRENSHEKGVATGLIIARELHKFLDDPVDAMVQAQALYTSTNSAYDDCEEALKNYKRSKKAVPEP